MGWLEEDKYQEQQIRKRIAEAVAEEREGCALLVDREAGIAHDDWNDRNMARELSKVAEMIRERTN